VTCGGTDVVECFLKTLRKQEKTLCAYSFGFEEKCFEVLFYSIKITVSAYLQL
jgi:hypothetical protein